MSCLTALFSKLPEPGKVKTRLCPPLDPAAAAGLAQAMLDDLVERHRAEDFVLVVSPAESRPWFERRYGLPVHVQRGADLGRRLANWFDEALTEHESVVVIGSDLPLLTRACVREAHERLLAGSELVLAPDHGGGYGLVGLVRPVPQLFTRVPMSSAGMLHATLALAVAANLCVESLAPLLDIDHGADLTTLARELDAREGLIPEPDFPRRTQAFLQSLQLLP